MTISVSDDANQATVCEMSCGLHKRPRGIVDSSAAILSGGVDALVMSVSTNPGATALTVIFQGANSLAQDLVNPEIADLAAA